MTQSSQLEALIMLFTLLPRLGGGDRSLLGTSFTDRTFLVRCIRKLNPIPSQTTSSHSKHSQYSFLSLTMDKGAFEHPEDSHDPQIDFQDAKNGNRTHPDAVNVYFDDNLGLTGGRLWKLLLFSVRVELDQHSFKDILQDSSNFSLHTRGSRWFLSAFGRQGTRIRGNGGEKADQVGCFLERVQVVVFCKVRRSTTFLIVPGNLMDDLRDGRFKANVI
jgi:hypothetical protein